MLLLLLLLLSQLQEVLVVQYESCPNARDFDSNGNCN